MTNLRSTLRTLALGRHSPKEVLTDLNTTMVRDTPPDRFVTMLYGILDLTSRQVVFASAGHGPLILFRASDRMTEPLTTEGFPLCVDGGEAFGQVQEEKSVTLGAGDAFVLYTDGITEAMNKAKEEFGEGRLFTAIQKFGQDPAQRLCVGIRDEVSNFVRDHPQSDDYSLVAVKVL